MYSRHLFIKTNQSCNLRCVYCYEKEKSSKIFDVNDTFLKVSRVLKESTQYGTKIKLIGGEPFLAFNGIKRFCELIWQAKFDEEIHFQITTNGTLVHGEIQDWLKEHRKEIDCKLSLDGDRISQDLNRPNSFDKIDMHFFAETWGNCVVNMVITPQTLPFLAKNVQFLHKQGFQNIVPIFAVLTDWNNPQLYTTYYKQLIQLAEYYVDNPRYHRCHTLSLRLERLSMKCDCVLCDIGKKMIFDVNSEKYYPCHLFFPSVCGDNHPKDMDNMDFSSRSKIECEPCLSCKLINICHTCYAANYLERGSLGNRDMAICEYRKIDFLINAKLESNRILQAKNVSGTDYKIMQVISNLQPELEDIEKRYINI